MLQLHERRDAQQLTFLRRPRLPHRGFHDHQTRTLWIVVSNSHQTVGKVKVHGRDPDVY
jgi:hypothetical protein